MAKLQPSAQNRLRLETSYHAATEALDQVYGLLSSHLDWHLEERLHHDRTHRNHVLLMLCTSLVIVAFIFWRARRNMIRQDTLESANRVRAVLDTVVDGIITIDKKGTIHDFNPTAEKIFGYTHAEVRGQNIRILMPEPDRSKHDGYLANYHHTHEAKIIGIGRETLAARKDGSTFPIELAVSQLEAGGERMYVGSIRDISERKRIETELQHYVTIQEIRNIELEEARKQAEIAKETKTEFLATVSHEIRTPMNGIIGMTDLLLETPLSEKQTNYAMHVMSSAKALLALINDILDFSRNESGKLVLEYIPMDLKKVMTDITQLLNLKALEHHITLAMHYPATMPTQFIGDPTRIRQVLTNLIDNAIKFTSVGEVNVTTRLLSTEGDFNLIEIVVRDTGIGIPQEVQHKMFTKFSQADATTTRKYGGTGLGLAICKQLTELMGGTIGFASEVGKGTNFWFTMKLRTDPAATNATQHPTNPAHTPLTRFDGKRILVAEDNQINQFYITELLEGLGIHVTLANNGNEAVEKACTETFDLIFMDCQMPEMDGYEATRLLKARMEEAQAHPTAIIAMTANAMQGDRERCLAAGMDDYATKPLEKADVLAVLNRWMPAPE